MIYITLLVYVISGEEDKFNNYEEQVIPLLEKYNGILLYRIRPERHNYLTMQDDQPYEIHIITFNSQSDFDRFRSDPDRKNHAHLYKESVFRTVLIEGAIK